MTNNFVSVGHSNKGNVCGGDLTINHSLPCKNGDGMLSYEDYQRFPYCNQCISLFRNHVYFRYQKHAIIICLVIFTLIISGFYFITGHLPNFMGRIFQENSFITSLVPLLSTLTLCCVILLAGRAYAHILAKKYIDQNLNYH